MTRVLFIYPNAISQGFIHGGIAILSAVLKEAGHETDLFDTTFYNIESDKIETSLQFKPTDLKKKIEKREVKFLVSDFLNKISTFKPDLIAITCTSNSYLLLKNLMEKTISNINCPIIIGGPKATISPEELIREEFINMVCIGEGEEALVEVANNIRDNKSLINIKNIWIKKNHRIHRNEVRLLNQNLDSLPLPDWSIFNEQHFYRPMYGNILKFGWFALSRGCFYSCSYCLVKDTEIQTDGSNVKIQNLRIGNKVKSFDTSVQKIADSNIVDIHKRSGSIYKLLLEDGSQLAISKEHPIYTKRGWIPVEDLRENDEVLKLE